MKYEGFAAPVVGSTPQHPVLSTGRFQVLDGLRGYLLIMMTVAHIQSSAPSHIFYLHHTHFAPVYDGEFFIFISGLVCAFAYYRCYTVSGFASCMISVLKRVRWLYAYQVIFCSLMLFLLNIAWPLEIYGSFRPSPASPLMQFIGVLTLSIQLPSMEVLALYMVLMLFIPCAFALLASGRNKTYFAILIAAWLAPKIGLDNLHFGIFANTSIILSQYGLFRAYFNPWSYAALFFGAFYLGYQYRRLGAEEFFATVLPPRRSVFATALVICLILAVIKRVKDVPIWMYAPFRDNITLVGLISTFSIIYIIYYLLVCRSLGRVESVISTALRYVANISPLVKIGNSSLFVYAFHALIVLLGVWSLSALRLLDNPYASDVVTIITIGVLITAAYLKKRLLPLLP